MYHFKGKEIGFITWRGKVITAIYSAGKQVYNAARACFSNGWNNERPWVNDEPWTNN